MNPTAYLIEGPDDQRQLWHAGTIEGDVNGKVVPLFKRDDIAPLRVPLIDQNDTFVGWHHRQPDDLLSEPAYRDEEGTIWIAPTADAYAKACAALHAKTARVEKLKMLLARVVDGVASLEEAKTLLEER